MTRSDKLLPALGVALLLHAALLVYGLLPQSEVLLSVTDDAGGAPVTVPGAPNADPAPEQAVLESVDAALDVDWPTPVEPEKSAMVRPQPIAKPSSGPPPAPAKPRVVEQQQSAPAAGLSNNAGYANLVRQHLARFAGALPPGASGEARVQFVVFPDGRVSDVHLVQRSGHAGLDAMALSLPSNAQPLPLPGPVAQRLEVPVQATPSSR